MLLWQAGSGVIDVFLEGHRPVTGVAHDNRVDACVQMLQQRLEDQAGAVESGEHDQSGFLFDHNNQSTS